MKKIINGKLYNTETAKKVGDGYSRFSPRDFEYWHEALYRKKTGEYFIHGEGGPLSKYAERVDGNNWSGGADIIPLSYQEARQWAEKNLEADEYVAIFGEPEDENGSTEVLYIKVPAAVARRIRQEAESSGMKLGDVVAGKFL